MGPLAVGTDGGGSIRIPCSFTGLFGIKASFGRVPAWPLSPFGTVAHVGPITRDVADAALMLTVMSQPDARDWYALPYEPREPRRPRARHSDLRIAYSSDLGYPRWTRVDATCQAGDVSAISAPESRRHPGFENAGPISRPRVLRRRGALRMVRIEHVDPDARRRPQGRRLPSPISAAQMKRRRARRAQEPLPPRFRPSRTPTLPCRRST